MTFRSLFHLLFPQLLRKSSNIVILIVFKNISDREHRFSVVDYLYLSRVEDNQELCLLWTNTEMNMVIQGLMDSTSYNMQIYSISSILLHFTIALTVRATFWSLVCGSCT